MPLGLYAGAQRLKGCVVEVPLSGRCGTEERMSKLLEFKKGYVSIREFSGNAECGKSSPLWKNC